MPFASFGGVNQHRQFILLGCALMSSEDITSYKMVLSTWLGNLRNVHPLAIMTDQCDSTKVVINASMPNTVHRYCIWHIFVKLPMKLSGALDGKIAKAEFKALVLDSTNVAEFERRWIDYIAKYNLDGMDWFYKLYLENEKWIPLFVQQYELAIKAKFEKELEAEYRSKYFEPKCLPQFAWEEKLQACYTREVFEFFQVQLRKLYHCEISTPKDHQENPGVEKYIITDYSLNNFNTKDPFLFMVEYTHIFKWFETRGILCCHILKVLSDKRIENINERYILKRWRRDVVRPHLKHFFLGGYPRMTSEYMMYRELLKDFERVCDIALV
ncbi:protein FAR1-RELATED SEQUENCE 6-like [Nicotiana tabacum]|uniref:Protein FAR1-RELATED SEQUENCE 6-like n=1 Tax=Nicotiana tabacum TaxID=4097 RepID=A0AC58SMP0_TOBAC